MKQQFPSIWLQTEQGYEPGEKGNTGKIRNSSEIPMRPFLSLYPFWSFQFSVVENTKQHGPASQGELLLEEDESISGQ